MYKRWKITILIIESIETRENLVLDNNNAVDSTYPKVSPVRKLARGYRGVCKL